MDYATGQMTDKSMTGAIVIVAPAPLEANTDRWAADGRFTGEEMLAGIPLACLEVFGESVLSRIVGRLRQAGVSAISLIAGREVPASMVGSSMIPGRGVPIRRPENIRSEVEFRIMEYAQSGIGHVALIRLGAYVEFHLADFLGCHLSRGCPVTRACDDAGPLDLWMIDTARFSHAESILRQLGICRAFFPPQLCSVAGYVNRLTHPADFRRLVLDSFLWRSAIRPAGSEVRPGIWVDQGAQVHRRARIVAPAYIGKQAKVQAGALITRFSNVEQGCQISRGTVVENASVLPHTCLGQWLDVSHAIARGSTLIHLRRGVTLHVQDRALLSELAPGSESSPSGGASGGRRWMQVLTGFQRSAQHRSAA